MKFLRVDPAKLDASALDEYKKFISPELLRNIDNDSFFIIAFSGEKPVGLAFISWKKIMKTGELYSLFVLPDFRRQGIGSQLFGKFQEEIKAQSKTGLITTIYPQDEETAPAWEKILKNHGWTGNRPFMIRCLFDGPAFNPPWINLPLNFPDSFQEFPWGELTENEKKRLYERYVEGHFSQVISPFNEEDRIELINSLGLRHEDEVVGWMITHRVAPDTIRYTALFINREYHFHTFSIKLLVDAIHLQKKSNVKWAMFELPLIQVASSWVHFVKKRLVPYADKITHFRQAWINFHP